MNERVTVAQANSLPLVNLVRSHAVMATKPQSDQAITLDLNNGYGKRDLSAVVNEKMTLMHVDTKPVILFDNQSTVAAGPFFDLSGKLLANLNVGLSAGHTFNGEQFAQSALIADDQSVLPAADPSSGADFHDVSIDSLPGNTSPLALVAQDMPEAFGRSGSVFGADFGVVAHAQFLVHLFPRLSARLRASAIFPRRAVRARKCSRQGFWPHAAPASPTARTQGTPHSRPRRGRARSVSARRTELSQYRWAAIW